MQFLIQSSSFEAEEPTRSSTWLKSQKASLKTLEKDKFERARLGLLERLEAIQDKDSLASKLYTETLFWRIRYREKLIEQLTRINLADFKKKALLFLEKPNFNTAILVKEASTKKLTILGCIAHHG